MGKTLVIAEKPSVGKDYAKALPGSFKAESDYLESDDFVVSWAVGHLVELAEPEDYDTKYKLWWMDRLPIIAYEFHLMQIEILDNSDWTSCASWPSAGRGRGRERL
jgi:DNA topoisomerase-3